MRTFVSTKIISHKRNKVFLTLLNEPRLLRLTDCLLDENALLRANTDYRIHRRGAAERSHSNSVLLPAQY